MFSSELVIRVLQITRASRSLGWRRLAIRPYCTSTSGLDFSAAQSVSAVGSKQFGLQAVAKSQTLWDTLWNSHIRNTATSPSQYRFCKVARTEQLRD